MYRTNYEVKTALCKEIRAQHIKDHGHDINIEIEKYISIICGIGIQTYIKNTSHQICNYMSFIFVELPDDKVFHINSEVNMCEDSEENCLNLIEACAKVINMRFSAYCTELHQKN